MLGSQKPLSWQDCTAAMFARGCAAASLPEKSFWQLSMLKSTCALSKKFCGRCVRDPCLQLKSSLALHADLTGVA